MIKGTKHTERTKRRIGEANKISLKGRKISLEIRNNMSNAKIGHKVSEETRRKIGNASRGRKHTLETRKKLSLIQIGKKQSEETKLKIGIAHKGMKRPIETGDKISKALKGKVKPKGFGEKIRKYKLGKKLSIKIRKKISMSNKNSKKVHRGSNHPFWKGGIWPINDKIKHSFEYISWRETVLKKDNYICQKYKIKDKRLHVHHINNFAEFPKLRFIVNNGITLSEKAHREFHKIYGYTKNNREQINKFLILEEGR